jgi:hypothetical protein
VLSQNIKIKRIDRLLSNYHLHEERKDIYTVLTQCILSGLKEPIIAVDWSPLCANQEWQLLRASIPVGGRSLTLYEEVHPQSKLGNRKVQHAFLSTLKKMLPADCIPIIVADAGFKTPFYRFIEEKLGWHWVGRIRGRDFICNANETDQWFGAKSLYAKAAQAAQYMGEILWVKSSPLKSFIVMIKEEKKARSNLTLKGVKRRSKKDKTHANAAKEPWLLVYGQSLKERTPKQIVNIYRTRMQIEEGFRDCKSVHYGLGLSQNSHMNAERRAVLCLLAALATFLLWCIGTAQKDSPSAKHLRANSSSKRESYSVVFMARLLCQMKKIRLSEKRFNEVLGTINPYMESVLCA